MAKNHGRQRRRMGRYIRGAIEHTQVISVAFTTKDVQSAIFGETVNERTLISSIDATYTLTAVTPVIGQGPIVCGVAHSDYSTAEIEEWLENTAGWNEGDMIGQEIQKRKIRQIGAFDVADDAVDGFSLNDGKAIKTKLNWMLLQGQTLRSWAYNGGLVSFVTTTPTLTIIGHANLFPQ